MKLSLRKIAELTGGSGEFDRKAQAEGYSIDSRTIGPGQLFFAVKGERLDGHDYVDGALQAGAVAAVVTKEWAASSSVDIKHKLVTVDDTLVALQTLGAGVRRLWKKTVVGVTGSAGKTTTKEAIARVLAARFRVLKSEGNLNNHFGMPMQLLRLEPEHEIAVIEMGMSHAGEIAALAKLAQPQVGVVTMVAPVHLEFFDSIAGIARAKYELIESLPANGTAVLNGDDEYVSQFGRDFKGRVIIYGVKNVSAEVRAENIVAAENGGSRFDLVVGGCREQVDLALIGAHNVHNALAAASVGLERGMTPSEIAEAMATLAPGEKRGQIEKITGATVINDCYNSNPTALNAMVDALAAMPAKRHIAVAGEMLELGPAGAELHRECGEHMAGKVDLLVGVRGLAKEIVAGASARGVRAEFVDTPEQAGEWLAREVREGDAVLVKASRGVRLERALETWKKAVAHSG